MLGACIWVCLLRPDKIRYLLGNVLHFVVEEVHRESLQIFDLEIFGGFFHEELEGLLNLDERWITSSWVWRWKAKPYFFGGRGGGVTFGKSLAGSGFGLFVQSVTVRVFKQLSAAYLFQT